MVDCYDYIRGTYHVPAYIGVRVESGRHKGVIVGARSDLHYVHVRLAGQRHSALFHPTDLTYLLEPITGTADALKVERL